MKTETAIQDAIRRRVSIRNYEPRSLERADRAKLEAFFGREQIGPLGNLVRLRLVDRETSGEPPQRLGTYGVIRGAKSFIVGAVADAEDASLDFGYVMEMVILEATGLGLGSCWLGGTFRRGAFAGAMDLRPGERIPAVTPVGYPAKSRSLIDRALRLGAGSRHRKPWSELFFDFATGEALPARADDPYTTVLEMLRRAPSGTNRQPWRIFREGKRFHFYLARSKGYPKQKVDFQRVDMGIAMCHFELTARELGLAGKWHKGPPASVAFSEAAEYIVTWSGS